MPAVLITPEYSGVITEPEVIEFANRIFYCGKCSIIGENIAVFHNVLGRHRHLSPTHIRELVPEKKAPP